MQNPLLTMFHYLSFSNGEKYFSQLQGKVGSWISRQQTANAGQVGTSKRDSACFPPDDSIHHLLENTYDGYTDKETEITLGRIRLRLHKQSNTVLWSNGSASKDSLYKFSLLQNCVPVRSFAPAAQALPSLESGRNREPEESVTPKMKKNSLRSHHALSYKLKISCSTSGKRLM